MIDLVITFDTDYLDRLMVLIEEMPLIMLDTIERSVLPAIRRMAGALVGVEPAVWTGGRRRWNSEKQRRYVLGYVLKRDAAGNIIPYVRTHALINAWSIMMAVGSMAVDYGVFGPAPMGAARAAGLDVKAGEPVTFSLFNPSNAAIYVQGKRQQLMHMDTGWPTAMDAAQVIGMEANSLLALEWPQTVQEQFRQVRRN